MDKISCICPFQDLEGAKECVYIEEGWCDEIDVNPGNGDAWCRNMIEEQLLRRTRMSRKKMIKESDKLHAINKFADILISQMKNLDPKIAKVLRDNFWDLILPLKK